MKILLNYMLLFTVLFCSCSEREVLQPEDEPNIHFINHKEYLEFATFDELANTSNSFWEKRSSQLNLKDFQSLHGRINKLAVQYYNRDRDLEALLDSHQYAISLVTVAEDSRLEILYPFYKYSPFLTEDGYIKIGQDFYKFNNNEVISSAKFTFEEFKLQVNRYIESGKSSEISISPVNTIIGSDTSEPEKNSISALLIDYTGTVGNHLWADLRATSFCLKENGVEVGVRVLVEVWASKYRIINCPFIGCYPIDETFFEGTYYTLDMPGIIIRLQSSGLLITGSEDILDTYTVADKDRFGRWIFPVYDDDIGFSDCFIQGDLLIEVTGGSATGNFSQSPLLLTEFLNFGDYGPI